MDAGRNDVAGDNGGGDHDFSEVNLPTPAGGSRLVMRFCPIPPGAFWMGERGGNANAEPRHRVVMPYEYWLGKYVVTQAEYRQVVEGLDLVGQPRFDGEAWTASPSQFLGEDRHPVEQVSWRNAVLWCQALTAWLRKYGRYRDVTVRLPTEMEWEYACRGGTETAYWCGDDERDLEQVAWFGEEWGTGSTHSVEAVRSSDVDAQHAFGLMGSHGNVWEWCHGDYAEEAYPDRASGATAAQPLCSDQAVRKWLKADRRRVIRGGAWSSTAGGCRSASRGRSRPGVRLGDRGFRVCLVRGPAACADQAGGGAASGKQGAEAEQAEPDKAGGARPTSGGAGEDGAGARQRLGRGVVCRDVSGDSSAEARSLLAAAAGRSPAARGADEATRRSIPFAVIGKINTPQSCGHTALDFSAYAELTHLFLWGLDDLEKITGLPENLVCLDVRGCTKLKSLPGGSLPHLETLDLGNCIALPGLPSEFAAPALRWLRLDGCRAVDGKGALRITRLIESCAHLEEVTLSGCAWLTELNLPDQTANPEDPSGGDPRFPARRLKKLVLRGCTALQKLPDLVEFRWLHHLDVRGCPKLEAMPALPVGAEAARPIGIRTLYATGCDNLRSFLGIDIRSGHRESTAAIEKSAAAEGKVNVAENFRALSADPDTAELPMAKVLILGSGRCGKTTVAKALRWQRWSEAERDQKARGPQDPRVRQSPTPDIRLDTLAFRFAAGGNGSGSEVTVHVWDFGGQEIYHNTHRLFASEGAVFVIVTTTPANHRMRVRKDIRRQRLHGAARKRFLEENRYRELGYWLDYVQEARGRLREVVDESGDHRPRIVVVVTGDTDHNQAIVMLRKQAGRHRTRVGGEIDVFTANVTDPGAFDGVDSPFGRISTEVESAAAEMVNELGVQVPRLYADVARKCQRIVERNSFIASEMREGRSVNETPIETKSLVEWGTLVSALDRGRTRTTREKTEMARAIAHHLHVCGLVFLLRQTDTVMIDQRWGVDLVYKLVVSPLSIDATRAAIHAKTHGPFSMVWLRDLLHREKHLHDHWSFLVSLVDACNIVVSLGNDRFLAVHPEWLPPMDGRVEQELVKSWGKAARDPDELPVVNHSFAIHDTAKGLVLGQSGFQRIVAMVARTMDRALVEWLLLGPVIEAPTRSNRERGLLASVTRNHRFWRDGFQVEWLWECDRVDEAAEPPAGLVSVGRESLLLRMEWKSLPKTESFRGGIFVQMLCADESTKADRLLEALFGRRDSTGKLIDSAPAGFPAPLAEYSYTCDSADTAHDLHLHDFRPADQNPETARCLRGIGQPGWLHAHGPKNGGRFDVAISYRRKASAEFVKAMHEALTEAGILAYYDLERMMDDPKPTSEARAPNTLERIYDTLKMARVLIVVPSTDYFASPVSQPTYEDNVFCPFELAEAVVAATSRPPRRDPRFSFWVSPDESGLSRADRSHRTPGQIGAAVKGLVQATFTAVVSERTKGTGDGESTLLHQREDTSIEDARRAIMNRHTEPLYKAVDGGEQYVTIPRSAKSWDFSALIGRIKSVLISSATRSVDD